MATGVTYSISDLAKEFDLTTRAIRFYEDMGLLQPQRTGEGRRVRVYSPRDRTRQQFATLPEAQAFGAAIGDGRTMIYAVTDLGHSAHITNA